MSLSLYVVSICIYLSFLLSPSFQKVPVLWKHFSKRCEQHCVSLHISPALEQESSAFKKRPEEWKAWGSSVQWHPHSPGRATSGSEAQTQLLCHAPNRTKPQRFRLTIESSRKYHQRRVMESPWENHSVGWLHSAMFLNLILCASFRETRNNVQKTASTAAREKAAIRSMAERAVPKHSKAKLEPMGQAQTVSICSFWIVDR